MAEGLEALQLRMYANLFFSAIFFSAPPREVADRCSCEKLAVFDKRGAQIVEYRFFGGLSQIEIAKLLGVTERTVRRSWVMAKTWIQQELQNEEIFS